MGNHEDALTDLNKAVDIDPKDKATYNSRAILHGEMGDFDRAFADTKLPERPDYEKANAFLIKARRLATTEGLP